MNLDLYIYYAWNCNGGSGLQVTFSNTGTAVPSKVDIVEFSNVINTSDPLHKGGNGSNPAGTPNTNYTSCAGMTGIGDSELLVGMLAYGTSAPTFNGIWSPSDIDASSVTYGLAAEPPAIYNLTTTNVGSQYWAAVTAAFYPALILAVSDTEAISNIANYAIGITGNNLGYVLSVSN